MKSAPVERVQFVSTRNEGLKRWEYSLEYRNFRYPTLAYITDDLIRRDPVQALALMGETFERGSNALLKYIKEVGLE